MTLTEEVRKIADSKPFYAVAGCGDYAVEKLRGVPGRLQEVQGRLQEVQGRLQGIAVTDRAELQQRAMAYAGSLSTMATGAYDDLARRGQSVVGRVQGQESTQQLESQAKTASSQTKAAKTSVQKTASTAKKAASESAGNVG